MSRGLWNSAGSLLALVQTYVFGSAIKNQEEGMSAVGSFQAVSALILVMNLVPDRSTRSHKVSLSGRSLRNEKTTAFHLSK